MSPILKNIIAVIAGVLFGSLMNGGIIMVSAVSYTHLTLPTTSRV